MDMPTSYQAHCSTCHRDEEMRLDPATRAYRCFACEAIQIVFPCLIGEHELRFSPEGDLECVAEGRILDAIEEAALMDAMPYRNRPADQPCCSRDPRGRRQPARVA